jgi:MFS family permease
VIAMFLPSLFAPIIVKLFGLSKMMIIGVVLYLACIIIGYSHNLSNYWVALVLLGLGWNFLFIGGTGLLLRVYHVEFLPSALYAYRLGKNILEYL